MVIFRVVAALVFFAVAGCVGFWLLTGERKYLRWAVRLVKVLIVLGLAFFAILILERVI